MVLLLKVCDDGNLKVSNISKKVRGFKIEILFLNL